METEIEIKLLGLDHEAFEKELINAGAVLDKVEDQINTRIDSSTNPLAEYSYLRIREAETEKGQKRTEITYKLRKKKDSARVNEEYGLLIEDKDKMLELLNKLGFDKSESAHKRRKSYLYMDYRIEFDTWDKESFPFPYIELEAPSCQAIDLFLDLFKINRKHISTASILELKRAWQNRDKKLLEIFEEDMDK